MLAVRKRWGMTSSVRGRQRRQVWFGRVRLRFWLCHAACPTSHPHLSPRTPLHVPNLPAHSGARSEPTKRMEPREIKRLAAANNRALAFEAAVWKELGIRTHVLQTIHRQKGVRLQEGGGYAHSLQHRLQPGLSSA